MGNKNVKVRTRPGRGLGEEASFKHFLEEYDLFKTKLDNETQESQGEIRAKFEEVNEEFAEEMFES